MKRFLQFCLILIALTLMSNDSPTKVTLWMIGDSTMAYKKPERAPESGWGEAMKEKFQDNVIVKNHAASGRSTKSFIDEGRWKQVIDSIQKGDYLIIQFGHNDQKPKEDRHTVPFASFNDNLELFVKQAQAKGALPIICSSIVRRHFNAEGKLIDTHGDYIAASKAAAEQMKVPYVDMNEITKIAVEQLGIDLSKEWYTFTKSKSDSTHLSIKGSSLVADLFLAEIRRQELPLSKLIKKEK